MRIALILSVLLAASAVEAARAPRTVALSAAPTTGGFGFRPTPMSYSHLRKGLRSGSKAKGFRSARDEIPSRWDSREHGWVTSVKNQNPYGTCWAFSTMAALETAVLKDSGGAVTNDYSENHLARHNVGFLTDYYLGGNNQVAAALLSAWRDPLREEDDPYGNPFSDREGPPCCHVQDIVWLPERFCPHLSEPGDYEVGPVEDNREVDEAYKCAVMEYGAVSIAYYHCWSNYDSSKESHYFTTTNATPSRKDGGHAVTLVGWDDDYSKYNFRSECRPPGNGAFLCKNSWGTAGSPSGGYIWISYYDEGLFMDLGAAYPVPESASNHGRIYEYDPCGQINAWNVYDDDEEERIGGKTNWCANVFTVGVTGIVDAVGFYSMEPGTTYSLRIVRGCAFDPSTGECVVEQSGVVQTAGFVTVPLNEGVVLAEPREKFAVALRLECPSYRFPLPVETTEEGYCWCEAHAGESFMSKDGTNWIDFQEYDPYGNFCIKAYTRYGADGEAIEVGEGRAFAQIQDALDVAMRGDEIRVYPGTYTGVVNEVEDVRIVSVGGPSVTFIDGGGKTRCLDDWRSAALVGFTLVNGYSDDEYGGGGACYGTLFNCVIRNCRSDYGGGAADSVLHNCLIVSNVATEAGGGVYNGYAYNCTIADNVAAGRGGGISMESPDYIGESVNCIAAFNVSSNGYESGNDIYDWNLCVVKCFSGGDPLFVDRTNGDYRLRGGSPCIDAGYGDYVRTDLGDLDGHARIVGATVDFGCYEYEQAVSFGEAERYVSAVAQDVVVCVYADGAWTLSGDADWLTPQVTAGCGPTNVVVAVGENESGLARTGTLTLNGGGCDNPAALTVSQVAGMPRGGRRYGLFVGVNQYKTMSRSYWLQGCVPDAIHMEERCVGGRLWRQENTTLLKDSAATKAAVRAWLHDAAATAVAGDVVLYYQSSHGGNEAYDQKRALVCLYDDDFYDSELADDLGLFAPGVRVVVIVDACNSGGLFKKSRSATAVPAWDFGGRVMSLLASGRRRKSAKSSGVGADVAFITAADYDQYSWDGGPAGSDFTCALAEGWKTVAADADKDGILNFRELYDYAAARAVGSWEEGVTYRTEAQCFNEPMLLGLMAEVVDPKWPDPGSDENVAATLENLGYTGALTSQVTTVAQYRELARWTEETGVTPQEQSAANTPLVSAALCAEGFLELKPEDVRILGFEPNGNGWSVRIGLDEYDQSRLNANLLKAAVGVVGSETPTGRFSSDGLGLEVTPRTGFIELSVMPPVEANAYFLKGLVR